MKEYDRLKFYTCDHRENDLALSYLIDGIEVKLAYSRKERGIYSSKLPQKPWPRLIAETYQANQVGSFAGLFDKPINCTIRTGSSVLTFKGFVPSRHVPRDACNQYLIDADKYETLSTTDKIKS